MNTSMSTGPLNPWREVGDSMTLAVIPSPSGTPTGGKETVNTENAIFRMERSRL